jgi:CheY-like chemotaxis protein
MISLNSLFVGPVGRLPWRVQTKLLVAFLAIVALLIALGAIGLYELSAVNQRTEELIKSERKIAAYRQVQHDTTSQLYSISSALLVSDERTLDSADGTRAIPVIGLTAHAMAGDREKVIEAGCDDYDTKPVELPRLLQKIEALLARAGEGT